MNNVIVALATAPIKSALAIIRLSGDSVFSMTSEIFSKNIENISKRQVLVGDLIDDGDPLDNVVLVAYPAPHTMTGEDVVEISCHGSMIVVNQIISAYLKRGARYAGPGEFTSRAFFNGKLDLVEAESVNDLINATTKEAKNLMLMSYKGSTSKLIEPVKKSLADLLSLIEVNIDYPEYTDIEDANVVLINERVAPLRKNVQELIQGGEQGQIITKGMKLAIVGAPNAGKSSLLNSLLKEEKAIVSDIPGTTRDVVEGEINLKGIPLHLLDTAGIHASSDKIEELGIVKSEQMIEKADIVIHVIDATKGFSEEDDRIHEISKDKMLITIYNKSDLLTEKDSNKLYISALNKDINPLLDEIYNRLGISDEAFVNPSLNNARQLGLLKHIEDCLRQVQEDCANEIPVDLISTNLFAAYNASRQLLGEEVTSDLTDEIFSRFCVGK